MQCDLTRSGFVRCFKLGKICPGYRQKEYQLFHKNRASYATDLASDQVRKHKHNFRSSTHEDARTSTLCFSDSYGKVFLFSGLLAIDLSHPEIGDSRQLDDLSQMQVYQYDGALESRSNITAAYQW